MRSERDDRGERESGVSRRGADLRGTVGRADGRREAQGTGRRHHTHKHAAKRCQTPQPLCGHTAGINANTTTMTRPPKDLSICVCIAVLVASV